MANGVEYWKRGTEVVEKALEKALKADPKDAPFPLTGEEARIWHQASADAYQHALEMMGVPKDVNISDLP